MITIITKTNDIMGAQIFLVAMVTFFFVKRLTSDDKVRVSTASGWRTLFFLFFFLVTGMMYYKTCQVTTVNNIIQVEDFISDFDAKTNKSNDTIEKIDIYNKFSTLGLFMDSYEEKYDKLFNHKDDSTFRGMGGVTIVLTTHLKDSIRLNPFRSSPQIKDMCDSVKSQHPELKQFYLFSLYSSSFKSFFPFKGRYRIQYEDVQDKDSAYFTTFLSCYPANITFIDKRCGDKITLDDDNTYEFSIALGVKNQHSAHKTITIFPALRTDVGEAGFFTASDITQYSYKVFVNGTIPVDTLLIRYNLPVEFMGAPNSALKTCRSIMLTGNQIPNDSHKQFEFYVKLPALENLQLIRSLILTTVLTAFFTLFISNLYYWICKRKRDFRRKYQKNIPYGTAKFIKIKRVKHFKQFIKYILFIIGVVLLIVSFRSCNDQPIAVDMENILLCQFGIFLIACILLLLFYKLYKFVIKPIYPKEEKDSVDLPPTIFIYEKRNEDYLYEEANWDEMSKDSEKDVMDDEKKDTEGDVDSYHKTDED